MDVAGRAYAEMLEDPRIVPRCDHRLFDIIARIVIAAQIREQKGHYVLQVKGNRDITSTAIAPMRSSWGARSASTGFWM